MAPTRSGSSDPAQHEGWAQSNVAARNIIRRDLGDVLLNPDRIATAANISSRYLHQIFQDTEFTPMQLLKRLRLEACHRALQDSTLATTPIKDVIAAHGYLRHDQFARDFKQLFGFSAKQIRHLPASLAR